MSTTSRHRSRISRARWHPASSIRESRRSFAAAGAASQAATWRRPPSSTSCRTMTRSAIGRWATGLKAPPIPMLFMGEEWGSKAPFPFFCDFGGDLADAVRKGRRVELAWAYAEYGDEVPDALDPSTRDSAVLDWK